MPWGLTCWVQVWRLCFPVTAVKYVSFLRQLRACCPGFFLKHLFLIRGSSQWLSLHIRPLNVEIHDNHLLLY